MFGHGGIGTFSRRSLQNPVPRGVSVRSRRRAPGSVRETTGPFAYKRAGPGRVAYCPLPLTDWSGVLRNQRRLSKPFVAASLTDDEGGHISARNMSAVETLEIGHRANAAGGWFVGQHGRPDDHPIERKRPVMLSIEQTICYDRLLPVLVLVDRAQQKWLNKPVIGETAVPGAVAGSETGDAAEARCSLPVHDAHQRPRRFGQQGNFPEEADLAKAERADDRFATGKRPGQRGRIACVPLFELGAGQQRARRRLRPDPVRRPRDPGRAPRVRSLGLSRPPRR